MRGWNDTMIVRERVQTCFHHHSYSVSTVVTPILKYSRQSRDIFPIEEVANE